MIVMNEKKHKAEIDRFLRSPTAKIKDIQTQGVEIFKRLVFEDSKLTEVNETVDGGDYIAYAGVSENRADIRKYNNGYKLGNTSWVATDVTQEEYSQLQELGVTKEKDAGFIAKLINDISHYRLKVAKDLHRHGLTTELKSSKEQICQNAFQRLRALEGIEACYGKSCGDLRKALENYKQQLESLMPPQPQGQEQEQAEEPEDKRLKKIREVYLEGLKKDKKAAEKLLNSLGDEDSEQKGNEDPESKEYHDEERGIIEQFLRKRTLSIGLDVKQSNELITLSGKKTFGRGRLQGNIATYLETHRHYGFDPNNKIARTHQGYFHSQDEKQQDDGKQAIHSGMFAHDRDGVKNWLFAISMVKTEEKEHKGEKEVISPGWSRFWHRNQNVTEIPTNYELLKKDVGIATENIAQSAYRILKAFAFSIPDAVKEAGTAIQDSVQYTFASNLRDDFAWAPWVSTNEQKGRDQLKTMANSFRKQLEGNARGKQILEKLRSGIKSPEDLKDLFKLLIELQQSAEGDDVSKKNSDAKEEVAQEMTEWFESQGQFRQWSPKTIGSVVTEFVDAFGSFFSKRYQESPLTWTTATAAYVLIGLLAIQPALFAASGQQLPR